MIWSICDNLIYLKKTLNWNWMMNFKWEVHKMHTVNYVDSRMHLTCKGKETSEKEKYHIDKL